MYLGYWTCFFVAGTLVQCHRLITKRCQSELVEESDYRIALLRDPREEPVFTETDARHLEDRCETMIKRLKMTQQRYEDEIVKLQALPRKLELESPSMTPQQGPQEKRFS